MKAILTALIRRLFRFRYRSRRCGKAPLPCEPHTMRTPPPMLSMTRCRHTANTLPIHCRHAANILPTYCHHTTDVLLTHCLHTTAANILFQFSGADTLPGLLPMRYRRHCQHATSIAADTLPALLPTRYQHRRLVTWSVCSLP